MKTFNIIIYFILILNIDSINGVCRFGDLYFANGTVWNLDACQICSCQESLPVCHHFQCHDPHCNFTNGEILQVSANQCCPNCIQQMKSCSYNGKIISDLTIWKQSKCENCKCYNGIVTCKKINCTVTECLPGEILHQKYEDCCGKCLPVGKNCTYNNIIYKNGEIWSTTNCSKCLCQDGTITCFIVECPPTVCKQEQHIEFPPGECCPVCVNKHCKDGENIHKDGEIWKQDPCTLCSCQAGHIICHLQKCPSTSCRNGETLIQKKDECCHSCVSLEDSCILENETHYSGDMWNNNNCEYCICSKGNVECRKAICEIPTCSQGEIMIHPKGKCCPECITDFQICMIGDKIYKNEDIWIHDKCTLCSCNKGKVLCFHYDCTRCSHNSSFIFQLNYKDCCPLCHSDKCLSPCKTCDINIPGSCTSCLNSDYVVYKGQCKEECPKGYFADFHGVCQSCFKNCRECFGKEENQCLKCSDGMLLKHGICVKDCGTDYFAFNNSCKECHNSCSSCLGPNKDQCLSCVQSYKILKNGQCIDSCNGYIIDNQCLACNGTCKSCLKNSSKCKSCHNNYYLQDGLCQKSCNPGYYPSKSFICLPCHSICKECIDSQPTSCIKCSYDKKLLKNTCVDDCGQGYYEDHLNGYCSECHETCRFCANGPTPDLCVSCNNGYLVRHPESIFGYCVEKCPSKHYISVNGVCEICHDSCLECDGPEVADCTKCNKDFNLKNGECVKTCGERYFSKNGICLDCHLSCENCYGSGSDECISCPVNANLSYDRCYTKCEPGKYLDLKEHCRDCHFSCAMCILKSEKTSPTCIQCIQHAYHPLEERCVKECEVQFFENDFGICEACHHSCLSCTAKSANSCTSCKKGKILSHNGRCVDSCFEGYFEVNGECQACDINCIRCNYDGQCHLCRDNLVLQFGECVSSCYEDYYLDYGTRECKECSIHCGKCHGPTAHDCISCLGNLLLEEGRCVVNCRSGFYQDGKECKVCNDNCKTCIDHSNCTSCHSPFLFLADECVKDCGIQKYPDIHKHICKECSENCLSCINSHHCNYCKKGYFLKHNSCVENCGTNYFPNEIFQKCELNEKSPVLIVNGIIIGEFNSYTVIDSSIISVLDDDTDEKYLMFSIVAMPTIGKLILQSEKGENTILKIGDTFSYMDLLNRRLLFKHSKKDELTGKLSIMVNDQQLNSNIEVIPIKIISNFSPVIEQIKIPIVENGKEKIISDKILIITDEDNLNEILINVVEAPHYGKFVRFPTYEKVLNFSIKDLKDENLIYQHDGSFNNIDMMVFQVWDGYNCKLGTFYFKLLHQQTFPPVLDTNRLIRVITDSEISITRDYLHVTDIDTSDDMITFTIISNPKKGRIVKIPEEQREKENWEKLSNGQLLKNITSFTQNNINKGLIWYQHYGYDTYFDSFHFQVSDNSNPPNLLENQIFNIEILSLQDEIWMTTEAPTNLGIFVIEDSDHIILNSQLNFQIEGVKPDNVLYIISLPLKEEEGRIEHIDKPGKLLTTFTQADINNGKIIYKTSHHMNFSEENYFFKFLVSDSSDPRQIPIYPEQTFSIQVKLSNNDSPKFNFPDPEIFFSLKSDTVIPIDKHLLTVTDPDTSIDKLILTLTTAPIHGTFLQGIEGQIIEEGHNFSYAEVLNESFYYAPDNDKNLEDKITITVSDGKHFTSTTLTIKFDKTYLDGLIPADSATWLLTVQEGKSVFLQRNHLAFFDHYSDDSEIFFTLLTEPIYGNLELVSLDHKYIKINVGNQFTQEDINNMIIRYTANSEIGIHPVTDKIYLNVSNAKGNIQSAELTLMIKPLIMLSPVITVINEIKVEEGKMAVIGPHIFTVTDEDTSIFNLTVVIDIPPKFGYIENIKPISDSEKSFVGFPILSFPLQDSLNLYIQYVQSNHLNIEPTDDSFLFHITDGMHSSSASYINITIQLINDEPPLIIKEELYIKSGQSILIENSTLLIYDLDTPETELILILDIPPKHGKLKKLKSTNQHLDQSIDLISGNAFSFQDMINELIIYIHDGIVDNNEDSFTVTVSDGEFYDTQTITIIIESSESENSRMNQNKEIEVTSESIVYFANQQYFFREEISEVEIEVIRKSPDLSLIAFVRCTIKPTDNVISGIDFTPNSVQVVFGPNQISSVCPFTISDVLTSSVLKNKTFEVSLNSPNGTNIGNPSMAIVIISGSNIDIPTLQFTKSDAIVQENQDKIELTIIRHGDSSYQSSVICFTEQGTAKAGEDFIERPNLQESKILFLPGEKSKICTIYLNDDYIFEDNEYFFVNLVMASEDKLGQIVLPEMVFITITNDEDITTLQLEKPTYSVKEPNQHDHIVKLLIAVIRSGDLNQLSRVRVNTRDGTAISGIDYHAKSTILFFDFGETKKIFDIEILYNKEKEWHKDFSVILGPEEPFNAKFGNNSLSVITIIDHEASGSLILPSPPIVISLIHYDNIEANINEDPSPSYPLICVTPCDPHFPDYATSKILCQKIGLNETNIYYSWETAIPSEIDGFHSKFKMIQDSTMFTSAHHKILDNIYFGRTFMIRCIAQPISVEGSFGIPLRSNIIKIGINNGICNINNLDGNYQLKSQSFMATLQYLNSSDIQHPNRLHIHIEIPHQDGMLPLISTFPLQNINYLLTESIYRQQHLCSNFLFPPGIKNNKMSNYGFLKSFDVVHQNFSKSYFAELYQYDSTLYEKKTLLLYQHLDLKNCIWKFDAWYHMSELVDLCGGNVISNFQMRDMGQTYLTVQLPLYVSYIYAAAPTGWIAMEHYTELEFSFFYNTILWRTGLETDGLYHSALQILRVVINKSGALTIEFKTQAKFRGLFILEHPTIHNLKSQVKPPENLIISFDLELLWTEQTFDGPIQFWKTTSKYNLKDYTGVYIIELIPCTVKSTQSYTQDYLGICTVHSVEKFEVPLVFQQSNRPVPVIYSLNTIFQLLNNENIFLSNPFTSEIKLFEMDYKGTFSRGQTVYGRVLWSPDQDLEYAYKLRIEKLFICSGRDGYIPTYDPTGEEYGDGPQFGCIQSNQHLKHRFLLLDRSNPGAIDRNFRNIPFEAKFAYENSSFGALEDIPGVDGFSLKVDALYKIDSGQQWFLQVLYTIRSANGNNRIRRSAIFEAPFQNNLHMKINRTERSSKMKSLNGTNMRILFLSDFETTSSQDKVEQTKWIIPFIVLLLLILFLIAFKYYRKKKIRSDIKIDNIKVTLNYKNKKFKENSCRTYSSSQIKKNSLKRLNNEISLVKKLNNFNIAIQNNLIDQPISGTEV